MKRRWIIHGVALLALWSGAGRLSLHAQNRAPQKIVLEAELKPGQVLRYEIEAAGSFLAISDAVGAMLNPPRGPCDYALASIVTLRPQSADKDGNIPVEARYSETRVTSVRCSLFSEADFEKRVAALQSRPVMFVVGPQGETAMTTTSGGYFKYWDGGELLRKVTQNLLQTQFAPQPVAEDASWKPRGQFAYSRDHALKDLELSGADLRFRYLVQVDGRTFAWITSQYVFSPVDLPAAGTASGGVTVPGAGNNAVAAVLHISLLLDPASHHIVWLHRSQTIDNKLTLASPYDDSDPEDDLAEADNPQYDSQDDDWQNPTLDQSNRRSNNPGRHPFMTFHFQEEARARMLPDERSVEWLAALKNFEATPELPAEPFQFPRQRPCCPRYPARPGRHPRCAWTHAHAME
jgi:hypothetical protein